jgi:L-amino acid N-acyltransferase YncA
VPEPASQQEGPGRGTGWGAKVLWFVGNEGPRYACGWVFRAVVDPLYSNQVIHTLSCPCDPHRPILPAAVPAEVIEIDESGLPLVDKFLYRPTAALRERMRQGDRCFVAMVEGQAVAYQWAMPGPFRSEAEPVEVGPNQVYFHSSRTLRTMRGKKLMPFLITTLCSRLGQEGLAEARSIIDDRNKSSLAAFQRSGFCVVSSVRYRHRFGRTYTEALR